MPYHAFVLRQKRIGFATLLTSRDSRFAYFKEQLLRRSM